MSTWGTVSLSHCANEGFGAASAFSIRGFFFGCSDGSCAETFAASLSPPFACTRRESNKTRGTLCPVPASGTVSASVLGSVLVLSTLQRRVYTGL